MPNRIIKESICTSEDIDRLSPMAEILFYRLMVNADDYGAYYGNVSIIKSNCFPLRSDDLSCDEVRNWLYELVSAGLIDLYKADGRDYIQFHKWKNHQQIRAKKRKFPEPEIICNQLIADDSKCPRNPIQSNTIQSESNPIQSVDCGPVYPTLDEVVSFAADRNSVVDPKRFYDWYKNAEWKDAGGNPIQNWRNTFLNWERSDKRDREKEENGTGNIFLKILEEENGQK